MRRWETLSPSRAHDEAVLEKRDYRAIPGAKMEQVWAKAWDWWQGAGFVLYHVGPGHLTGSSTYSKIGLRREIELRFVEANDALYVDLAFRARLTDEGAVGGAVAAVVFFPVAAVGGAISWSEYENEANGLITNFWFFLSQVTGKPNYLLYASASPLGTPYPMTPPVPPPPAKTCGSCGAGVATDWKACPSCGSPLSAPQQATKA